MEKKENEGKLIEMAEKAEKQGDKVILSKKAV